MKKIFSQFFFKQRRGFTLVETLVALTILMLSITPSLVIISQGVFYSNYNRDEMVASYLAQEGIDLFRAIRDQNVLEGKNWYRATGGNADIHNLKLICEVVASGAGTSPGCDIDVDQLRAVPCSVAYSQMPNPDYTISNGQNPNICGPLYMDINGIYRKWYGPSTYSQTEFARTITSQQSGGANGSLLVTSKINWKSGPLSRSYVIYDVLENWQ